MFGMWQFKGGAYVHDKFAMAVEKNDAGECCMLQFAPEVRREICIAHSIEDTQLTNCTAVVFLEIQQSGFCILNFRNETLE